MRPTERYLRRVIRDKCADFQMALTAELESELVTEFLARDWPSDAAIENEIADAVREIGEPRG